MNFSICKQTPSGHQGKVSSRCVIFINKVRVRRCSAILFAIGLASMLLTSCGSEKSKLQFKTAKEGINYYREFYRELKTVRNNDMADIATDIAAWQELEDSVEAVILRDTASAKSSHFFPHESVSDLHVSVREEFLNRAIAKPRTLQDLLTLKLETNRMAKDPKISEAAKAAVPFFLSLDSVSIYNMDIDRLISRYQKYLLSVEKSGIHTKEQFLAFLREEDRLFRSFATHLLEVDGKSVTNITKTTERIYAQWSREVTGSSSSYDDIVVLMTMRANRRLLVNAQECLQDTKNGKIKSSDLRTAYQWMIVQLFVAINGFGLALLTEEQKATFSKIAKEASPSLVRLAGQDKADRDRMTALPDLMIKIYISSL